MSGVYWEMQGRHVTDRDHDAIEEYRDLEFPQETVGWVSRELRDEEPSAVGSLLTWVRRWSARLLSRDPGQRPRSPESAARS